MNQALPIWTCEFKGTENLTVGSLFKLNCHGEIEVAWNQDPLKAVFPAKDFDYALVVLKSDQLSPKAVELTVTSYRAGQLKPEYIRIVQGEQGFEFSKPDWTVQSVLKPNEQPKPYPSFGPWNLPLPVWFLASVALVLAIIGYLIFRTIRRYNQRTKMLVDLEKHRTALSPLHQFYRDSRNLRRRLHNVKQTDELTALTSELDREFRLYVLRQFKIPTLDWTDREIIRDMKKRHRKVYYRVREPLRKTLRELSKLKGQKQVLFKDVEQLHKMSLDTVEKIDGAVR